MLLLRGLAQAQCPGSFEELVQGLAPVGFQAPQLGGTELVSGDLESTGALERSPDALEPLGHRRAEHTERGDAATRWPHDVEWIVEQALAVACAVRGTPRANQRHGFVDLQAMALDTSHDLVLRVMGQRAQHVSQRWPQRAGIDPSLR
jgi:hypothetical protein